MDHVNLGGMPFITREKSNELYHHTRLYIQSKSKHISNKSRDDAFKKMAEALGYKNPGKLAKRRKEWDDVIKPVPLAYLAAIGVDLKVLDFALELDRENFEERLAAAKLPETFILHLMSFAHAAREFPRGLSEAEGIEYVRTYTEDNLQLENATKGIYFENLKTVYIKNNNVTVRMNTPSYAIKDTHLEFIHPAGYGMKIG